MVARPYPVVADWSTVASDTRRAFGTIRTANTVTDVPAAIRHRVRRPATARNRRVGGAVVDLACAPRIRRQVHTGAVASVQKSLNLSPGTRREPVARAGIDLFWLPLGAGGHSVRLNGRVFEAVAARAGRRPVCDLYHSALEVYARGGRFVIEMTPVAAGDQPCAASSRAEPWVPGGRDACGSSDTRCVGRTAAGSRTSSRR